MKVTKILLTLVLVITTFPYFSTSKVQAEEIANANRLAEELRLTVERLSGAEVLVKGPNNVVPDSVRNLRTRADSNGKANITIPLGTQKDDPSICSPSLERGLGVSDELVLRQAQHDTECQDGEYTVTITSIDAAGNRSEATVLKMIRDTIAPRVPEVGEIYICGSSLCVNITGEAGAEVLINNQPSSVIMTSSNVTLSLVEGYQSNTTYNFNLSLKDKATNVSGAVTKSFTTPVLGRGSGGNGNEADVYGASTSAEYNGTYILDLEINGQTGDYRISI